MDALTVLQPYASALVAGVKPWENRGRHLFGCPRWITIHAGKRRFDFGGEADFVLRDMEVFWPGMPTWDSMPLGAVLGVVRFTGSLSYSECNSVSRSWWACGPCCWRVGRYHALRVPVPCRGSLGIWKLPAEVECAVEAQLPADVLQAIRRGS